MHQRPECNCTSFLSLMAPAHKFMQQHILFTTCASQPASLQYCVFAVASRGSEAASVIAALPVITASPTVYHVTATRAASRPACATQTRGSVSARCACFAQPTADFAPRRCSHGGWVFNSPYCMIAHLQRNVGGDRCDACNGGSFHFDPSSRNGCTGCFCFGATDRCQSSSKRRGKVCLCYCAAA